MQELLISIHAAREGGDIVFGVAVALGYISIHAAREGGDRQRTLPNRQSMHISIHAAREGGDRACQSNKRHYHISIHAAREGGDAKHGGNHALPLFQSTPPVKAATSVRIKCRAA